jgi:hypothetical protein
MKKESKSLVVLAGALAGLAVANPSPVKAMHSASLVVSPAPREIRVSQAAQKVIETKVEKGGIRLLAFQEHGVPWVQAWQGQWCQCKPLPPLPWWPA